jgi:hypothetical protein
LEFNISDDVGENSIEAFDSRLQILLKRMDDFSATHQKRLSASDGLQELGDMLVEVKAECSKIRYNTHEEHSKLLSLVQYDVAQKRTIKSLELKILQLNAIHESSLTIASQKELNLVYSSLSWRVTQPLRTSRLRLMQFMNIFKKSC